MAGGILGRLRDGLSRTRSGLAGRLGDWFGRHRPLDESVYEELEAALIQADVGVGLTLTVLASLREQARRARVHEAAELLPLLREELSARLTARRGSSPPAAASPVESPAGPAAAPGWPHVILFVGVNGSGKTTTVGKMAARLRAAGHGVLLAAADTFRAAAAEQLAIWAQRAGADLVRHQAGADPSAVVFDALKAAAARGISHVLVDTAGRLHTKGPLMEELRKIRRVMGREVPGAPQETLLVIDGTTGQNAIAQAREFHAATPLTGVVVTKLDGTAKGGVVLAIEEELGVPVQWVGVGERPEDLLPYDPVAFLQALLPVDRATT